MKSLEEIEEMLKNELNQYMPIIKGITRPVTYFNQFIGNTSFLLVGLLEAHLRVCHDQWTPAKWMDDSLITDVKITDEILSIEGIAIWGIENDIDQWTEPLLFTVLLRNFTVDITNYSFLFGDTAEEEVSYGDFRFNRDIWTRSDRDWRYIVNVKSGKII